jgi:hypothetical protein
MEAKHASTFIRFVCMPSKTPIVVHLDSNNDHPQSTNPKLLGYFSVSTLLNWMASFSGYFKISLFSLEEHIVLDRNLYNEKQTFMKEIVEGRPRS